MITDYGRDDNIMNLYCDISRKALNLVFKNLYWFAFEFDRNQLIIIIFSLTLTIMKSYVYSQLHVTETDER